MQSLGSFVFQIIHRMNNLQASFFFYLQTTNNTGFRKNKCVIRKENKYSKACLGQPCRQSAMRDGVWAEREVSHALPHSQVSRHITVPIEWTAEEHCTILHQNITESYT